MNSTPMPGVESMEQLQAENRQLRAGLEYVLRWFDNNPAWSIVHYMRAVLAKPARIAPLAIEEEPGMTKQTLLRPIPPVILLNTIHPDVGNLYDVQEILAEHFQVTIEELHEGLELFEVRPFTTQYERDCPCSSLPDIEESLLDIERAFGATLQVLAERSRIVLLLDGCRETTHIEFAAAFALLVAAMSSAWPDVVSIQFDEERTAECSIIEDLPLRELLGKYSNAGRRTLFPPKKQEEN